MTQIAWIKQQNESVVNETYLSKQYLINQLEEQIDNVHKVFLQWSQKKLPRPLFQEALSDCLGKHKHCEVLLANSIDPRMILEIVELPESGENKDNIISKIHQKYV